MTKEELDPGKVLVIHDFPSGEECAALIRRSEGLSYEEANRAARRKGVGSLFLTEGGRVGKTFACLAALALLRGTSRIMF